jgi:hypothetical protein
MLVRQIAVALFAVLAILAAPYGVAQQLSDLPDAPSYSSSLTGLTAPATQITALRKSNFWTIRGPEAKSHRWTKGDKALFWLNAGILFLDWGETLNIAQNPERFHEMNPILGRHPSVTTVNLYFGAVIATRGVTSYLLPRSKRRKLEIISLGEGWTQINNPAHHIFPKF